MNQHLNGHILLCPQLSCLKLRIFQLLCWFWLYWYTNIVICSLSGLVLFMCNFFQFKTFAFLKLRQIWLWQNQQEKNPKNDKIDQKRSKTMQKRFKKMNKWTKNDAKTIKTMQKRSRPCKNDQNDRKTIKNNAQ